MAKILKFQGPEVAAVTTQLRGFRDEIDSMLDRIGDKRFIPREEVEQLREDLKALKARLKTATKQPARNETERLFLLPAVQTASANLLVSVGSHPVKSHWFGNLYDVRDDINHLLHQLEE